MIKDATDAPKWANYLDLHLECDEDDKLYTRLYDECDDFDFPIVNFLYLSSIIPESPAYDVFVAQLICNTVLGFVKNMKMFCLFSKLLKQGYSSRKLQTTLRKLYGRHTDFVHKCDASMSHMLNDLFTNCDI